MTCPHHRPGIDDTPRCLTCVTDAHEERTGTVVVGQVSKRKGEYLVEFDDGTEVEFRYVERRGWEASHENHRIDGDPHER